MQTPQKGHAASNQIKVMTVLILLIESSIVCRHCFYSFHIFWEPAQLF